MLLRAAIVMLVMLNLGAAGWWAFRPEARAVQPATGNGLRLLAEAAPAPASAPPPAIALAPATDQAATANEANMPGAASDAPTDVSAAATCLRFGPFADASAGEALRATLQGMGAQATVRSEPARGVRGWKVFLPPQPSRAAAQAQAERLKAAGISDLFVMSQGEDANSIALGRFSSEKGARQRQAELQSKGVQAQVAPVGGTPAQGWVEARIPAQVDRAALARLAPGQPMACARLR